MPEILDWLGRWENPNGGISEETEFVPAEDAKGYQYKGLDPAKFNPARCPRLGMWMDKGKAV